MNRRLSLPIRTMLALALTMAVLLVPARAEAPWFDDLAGMQEYLCRCSDERAQRMELYLADAWAMAQPKRELGAFLADSMPRAVWLNWVIETEGGALHITLTPTYRSGVRMADAWEQGDLSGLTLEEKLALDRAKAIVAEVTAETKDPLEVERALHDRLCRLLSYRFMQPDAAEIQRVTTATGALMDGKANCQGYADAFYLLGTLAGLEVDFQNGYNAYGTAHTWNQIRLDGQWYLLDVQGDDEQGDEEDPEIANYTCFNLGGDLALSMFDWGRFLPAHQLAPYTDGHYFYFADREGFGSCCESLDEMAAFAYGRLRRAGEEKAYAMIRLEGVDQEAVNAALSRACAEHPGKISWRYTYWRRGEWTYFLICFTEY